MGLKTKYQYTYFIYPFVVKESKYTKYLLKMLKDEHTHLKIFEKEKDLQIYQYFLPKVSEFMFSSFYFTKEKLKKLEDLPQDTKAALLSEQPCTIFEYHLNKDPQGKIQENSIFFKIQKIEIICFKTGICFLTMKTNIEDSNDFADVLNFNYKFKDIPKGELGIGGDNIHLQTDVFSDMSKLSEFIESITSSKVETLKLDVDTQRFLSYSYVCVDQQSWGAQKDFENIEQSYIKFSNFLALDNNIHYENNPTDTYSKWKYAKIGVSKQGVSLFASDADMNNYTVLPHDFEGVYLYTYILNLYKKIYLKKLELEFRKGENANKLRKKFIEFTKKLWVQEVTDDEVGTWLNQKLIRTLEIDRLYAELKNQYDVIYKNMRVEKNTRVTLGLIFILGITLLIQMISLMKYFNGF